MCANTPARRSRCFCFASQVRPTRPSIVLYAIPAAGALLIAGLFRRLQQKSDETYVQHWMYASLSAALSILLSGLVAGQAASHRMTYGLTALTTLALVADCAQGAWLLLGAYELARGREVTRRALQATAGILALTALALATLLAGGGMRVRDVIAPTILYSIVTGCTWLVAAAGVWRALRGAGRFVASAALGLSGLEHLMGLGIASPLRTTVVPFGVQLTALDFLLQGAMAVGVVLWLLEQEWGDTLKRTPAPDSLTGLPKRRHFRLRLDIALANARQADHRLAVFFLDLDRFKQINDTLGHAAGDHVLRTVAERVQAVLGREQTVTRFGGDEFTILAPRIHDHSDALGLASNIRDAVVRPTRFQDQDITISTSIGISVFPDHGEDAETLLGHADEALYAAKHKGRDTFAMYTAPVVAPTQDASAR